MLSIPYSVVNCTHVGSASTSFGGLGNVAQEDTSADMVSAKACFGHMVTVNQQERELHRPSSCTKWASFLWYNYQQMLCLDDTYQLLHFGGLKKIKKIASPDHEMSSRKRLLEHLKSSGIKIMMRGLVVLQLQCMM